MIVSWVRHGPTHQKNFVGWRDVPADLSDKAQIARPTDYLPRDARVVSSDLTRSVDTATAIQGSRDRLPHVPGLREFHFGAWDGVHFSKIAEDHPVLSRKYWEEPGDHTPPGGESWNMGAARMSAAVDTVIAQNGGTNLIIVVHIGVILTQVQRALNCSAYEVLAHKIDNLSVTQIDMSGDAPKLLKINHLP